MADNNKDAERLEGTLDELRDSIRDVGTSLKMDLIENLRNADELTKTLVKTTAQDLNKALGEVAKTNAEIESNQEKIGEKSLKSKDVAKQIAALKREEARALVQITKAETAKFLTQDASQQLQEDILNITKIQTDELMRQAAIALKQEKINKSNAKYHERLEKAFTTISKIPILGSFIQVNKIMDKVKKTAEEGGSKWQQLGAGLGETFKQLTNPVTLISAGITGIISLFTTLFKWALEFNQKVFDAAKNIGVSVKEAERLHGQFQAIAASGMNLGLQAKDLVKTYSEMNDQLGFMVPSSADFAGNMTLIQKRTGASAADMEAIATASAFTGKSVRSTYGTMIATAKVEAARNGFMMTNRQILGAISKVSAGILLNFKGNVQELVRGVVEAKKLGVTLDQVRSRGDALLDFESSISKEFELQAMTGRSIDLQKARQLALSKDTVGLMRELNEQGFTAANFSKDNRIQNQMMAEVLGISTDELEKQFVAQQQIVALGGKEGDSLKERYQTLMKTVEGRKLIERSLDKETQADLARSSANDEWEATLQRIKDLLGSILQGPVTQIVHTVAGWLNNTKLVQEFGMKVRGVFQGIADFVKKIPEYAEKVPNLLNKIILLAKVWFSISAATAAANVAASMGATPIVGLALGLAAAAAMFTALSMLVPDIGGGPTPAPAVGGSATITPMNSSAASARTANEVARGQRVSGESTIINKSYVVLSDKVVAESTNRVNTQDSGLSQDVNTGKPNGSGARTG